MRKIKALVGFIVMSAVMGLLVSLFFVPGLVLASTGAQSSLAWFDDLPSELPQEPLPGPSTILASDGSKIASFYSENRVIVTYEQIPETMKDAILAIEDHRFYEHGAVDPKGMARAIRSNLLGGQTQGASTLTQQYVKNVLLNAADSDEERAAATASTINRKLREARYALAVEESMSKDEILTGYLNISYFGAGAYGVGAASQRFFSVPVEDLSIEQAALLAGLVQSPTNYDPIKNPDRAKERRNLVLTRMEATGRITTAQMDKAIASDLELKPSQPANGCTSSPYPYYCEWIKKILRTDPVFGQTPEAREKFLYRGGLTIQTSLDPKMQEQAQKAVDEGLGRDNRVAGGMAVVEPGTGKVLAMAQNRTFGAKSTEDAQQTEINLVTTPNMQTGSVFKPFTLVAALENGWKLDNKLDAPSRHCVGSGEDRHCIGNMAAYDAGVMNVSTAMSRSSNTFFTTLTEKYGVAAVADAATRAGMEFPETLAAADITISLGTYETSPLDLANSYATLFAHGVACRPVGIVSMTGPDGDPVSAPDPGCKQAIEPRIADQVVTVMRDVVDGKDQFRTGRRSSPGFPVAAKTGTTNSGAAVWFAGGTPDVAMSLWLGDPRGGFKYPLKDIEVNGELLASAFGGTAAGPMWREAMKGIHPMTDKTPFAPTSPVRSTTVVPDVRGMKDTAAFEALTEAGFRPVMGPDEAQGSVALSPDAVTKTEPAAGQSAPTGSVVTITMSPGSQHNLVTSNP